MGPEISFPLEFNTGRYRSHPGYIIDRMDAACPNHHLLYLYVTFLVFVCSNFGDVSFRWSSPFFQLRHVGHANSWKKGHSWENMHGNKCSVLCWKTPSKWMSTNVHQLLLKQIWDKTHRLLIHWYTPLDGLFQSFCFIQSYLDRWSNLMIFFFFNFGLFHKHLVDC